MATVKKPIKKDVKTAAIDNTAVVKPKRKPEPIAEKSNYTFLKSSEKGKAPTKKDSTNYNRGYNIGRKDKKSLFMASDMNTYMGSVEGSIDKDKPKKKLKTGGSLAKDGKWMQKAAASIKKRGTKGVCTGAKFGGPTCKPRSKRYALAKTFKKIAKSNKKK